MRPVFGNAVGKSSNSMAHPIAQPTGQSTGHTNSNQSMNASWTTESVPRWRANPEKLAWAVILVSFSIFAALTLLIPWSIQYTIRHATVSQQARLESTLGTLFFYPSDNAEPIAITEPRFEVAEGSRIEANGDATQGTLGLFGAQGSDELLGSVQIYAGTTLEILRMRRPYFESSPEPYAVHLNLVDGQARVFTSTGGMRPVQVKISRHQVPAPAQADHPGVRHDGPGRALRLPRLSRNL